ncbi:MAG: GTPase ObgE [Haliscomenobacter sp.]
MAEENFVDYVKICCRSGAGGSGIVHFYRDRFTARGGPDGGDGGRGGHIILRGNRNVWTLLSLKYRKHVLADAGKNGGSNTSFGASGEDVILDVPLGTVARDAETGEIDFEITEHGEEEILVPGGRGGLGNAHFATPSNQAPRFAQTGEPGREEWKILELKVLADVGLVGFPNAGKSTLLSVITAAKPKIGDYPFTTLTPNLGIVQYRDGRSFVIADIPGIIEHAHEGKGLGHRFLRHIERNATLLFMIPADTDNIQREYDILLNELRMYNPELMDKPRVLALTKSDRIDAEIRSWLEPELPQGIPYVFISALTNQGLDALKDLLWNTISATVSEPVAKITAKPKPKRDPYARYALPKERPSAHTPWEDEDDTIPDVGWDYEAED